MIDKRIKIYRKDLRKNKKIIIKKASFIDDLDLTEEQLEHFNSLSAEEKEFFMSMFSDDEEKMKEQLDEKIEDDDIEIEEEKIQNNDEVDSEGNKLSNEDASFFANSQIRDKSGRLSVLYHNSDADFSKFDVNMSGKNQGSTKGQGIYLSKSKNEFNSPEYGKNQYKIYANIINPYNIKNEFSKETADYLIRKYDNPNVDVHYNHLLNKLTSGGFAGFDYIKYFADKHKISTIDIMSDLGYDGIIDGVEIIAFNPDQIKIIDKNKVF